MRTGRSIDLLLDRLDCRARNAGALAERVVRESFSLSSVPNEPTEVLRHLRGLALTWLLRSSRST